MITAIEHYLAVRHAAGFTLSNTTYLLRSFGRFAMARGDTHICTATAIAWAAQSCGAALRNRPQHPCLFVRDMVGGAKRGPVCPHDVGDFKGRRPRMDEISGRCRR